MRTAGGATCEGRAGDGRWSGGRSGLLFGGDGALRFGLNAAAVSAAVALAAFAASFALVPTTLAGTAYYEIMFWGGGHALQFTWTLLMLVGWLALASACGAPVALSPRITLLMLAEVAPAKNITPTNMVTRDRGASARKAPAPAAAAPASAKSASRARH